MVDREAAVGPESTTLEVSGSYTQSDPWKFPRVAAQDLAQSGLEALTHFRRAHMNAHTVAGLGQPGVALDNGLLAVAGERAAVVIERHADAPAAAGLIFLDLVPVVGFAWVMTSIISGSFTSSMMWPLVVVSSPFLAKYRILNARGLRPSGGPGGSDGSRCRTESEVRRSHGRRRWEDIRADALALEIGVVEGIHTVGVEHAAAAPRRTRRDTRRSYSRWPYTPMISPSFTAVL